MQYESMSSWVDLVERLAGPSRIWDAGFQYGDWLDPTAATRPCPRTARPTRALVATAYFARSSELIAEVARILGKVRRRGSVLGSATRVAAAFREQVRAADRATYERVGDRVRARLVLRAPCFTRRTAGAPERRLAEIVAEAASRSAPASSGRRSICDALCSNRLESTHAYRLLLQQDCPSWLYPLTMGATTIWERWDSLLPDGSVNPGEMTSFNHYAFGAVADWLHRTVAGLAPEEPGYRRILIDPRPNGGLTSARAALDTPYGLAEVDWTSDGEHLELRAVVPANTTATVRLPGNETPLTVGSGTHAWRIASGSAEERELEPLSSGLLPDL